MTGHGQASGSYGETSIDVEIRTVNNRFLKVSSKISEAVASIDSQMESIVREFVKRGSVTVSLRVSLKGRNNAAVVNSQTVQSYIDQVKEIGNKTGITFTFALGDLLSLPGVLDIARIEGDESLVDASKETLRLALQDLQNMRQREGAAMASQFDLLLVEISQNLERIRSRTPGIVSDYRTKLEQKVRAVLSGVGYEASDLDLLRETLLFADRTDVSEEITRLSSHLVQFQDATDKVESQGRRLDFLIQEMFREVNTIGSKGNDSEISQYVVSIKTTIEQMRELVQNVE